MILSDSLDYFFKCYLRQNQHTSKMFVLSLLNSLELFCHCYTATYGFLEKVKMYYLLTWSNNFKSSLSNFIVVLYKISFNCETFVALATGPPTFGWADNQARETEAGTVYCQVIGNNNPWTKIRVSISPERGQHVRNMQYWVFRRDQSVISKYSSILIAHNYSISN